MTPLSVRPRRARRSGGLTRSTLYIDRVIAVPRVRRPSQQTVVVLRALAESPSAWRYGYELCQQVGLKAGSMYPILMRLADRGLLKTSWETDVEGGRPPRHLYRLTARSRRCRRARGEANAWPPRSPAAAHGDRLMDFAARIVAIATHLLPVDRRDWGAAMKAELSQVDGTRGRLRFALGCARAALFSPRRPESTVGSATVAIMLAGVAGCIAMTWYTIARYPIAGQSLSLVRVVSLASRSPATAGSRCGRRAVWLRVVAWCDSVPSLESPSTSASSSGTGSSTLLHRARPAKLSEIGSWL